MNKFSKVLGVAAVGVAGYLIGFYEMKYKTMEAMVEVLTENMEKEEAKEESN